MAESPKREPLWADARLRGYVLQALFLAAVVALFAMFALNAAENLRALNRASGFGFLDQVAGFDIAFHLIDYGRASTFLDALWVGLLNTLLVAVIGIVLATVLGFLLGIGQLSSNWLVAKLATAYIEFVRNVPLLLQIFFWYFAMMSPLPRPQSAIDFGGVAFLSNRGLFVPRIEGTDGSGVFLLVLAACVSAFYLLRRLSHRRRERTGTPLPMLPIGAGLLVIVPVAAFFLTGAPFTADIPVLSGRNFTGGMAITPELIALVLALSLYTASYIGEIVRSGIEGVPKGQAEASAALGLSRGQRLRLVIIPQAMRIIIPPLTSQYLSLTKNSSLAAAIAFPDLVHVFAGTALNQTGQAIEILAITMIIYLAISLLTSLAMNIYNARIQLKER